MKNTIMLVLAIFATTLHAERMASQTYVERKIDTAKEEIYDNVGRDVSSQINELRTSVDYIEGIFNAAVPALTNAWEYESMDGTNKAWYVVSCTFDTEADGKFLAYTGTVEGVEKFCNIPLGWTLNRQKNYTEISAITSEYTTVDYEYVTAVVTNETYVYQMQTNWIADYIPIYSESYWTNRFYTNTVNGKDYVIEEQYNVEPELLGYNITNRIGSILDVSYTNTTYDYKFYINTNFVDSGTVTVFTNVYDKYWVDAGGRIFNQQNKRTNMQYVNGDDVIKMVEYPCSDEIKKTALGVTDE